MSFLKRLFATRVDLTAVDEASPSAPASQRTTRSGDDSSPELKFDQLFGERVTALESKILELCASGKHDLALRALKANMPMPRTASQARVDLERLIVPILGACVQHKDAPMACGIEQAAYGLLIKSFEDPDHAAACFRMMDPLMHELGAMAAAPSSLGSGSTDKLLFFLHNLEIEYAHTALLCDLMEEYLSRHPAQATKISIAGVVHTGSISAPVQALRQRWDIAVLPYDNGPDKERQALLDISQRVGRGEFDRVVVVSVPLSISYLTGLLAPNRLSWLTMKYQLPCFEHLEHRCSFRSGVRRAEIVDGKRWLQAAPLFRGAAELKPTGSITPVLKQAREARILLYTINREEKIRNPRFLWRVARILHEVDDALFVWTGRERLPAIVDFFASQGLAQRHLFAGWVVPDNLMQIGDLFLDTPILSGNVAAQATAAGVPVVTDAEAVTWVGTFWPIYEAERGSPAVREVDQALAPLVAMGVSLQACGDDDYVRQSVLLARDPHLRRQFAGALKAFAAHYFFNAARAAEDHFDNLRAPIA